MKILVTGANGFLGHYLVKALEERGEDVRALVLPGEDSAWLRDRDVAIHTGDIRQPGTLTVAMDGVEGVFHLAAMMGVWRSMKDYFAVNVTGAENVCEAALGAGVRRLIHVSSAMVYRMWVGHPVTEDEPLRPLQEPYASSKAAGDRMVRRFIDERRLPAVIIRPGTLFGPGDHLNFGRMADRILSGKSIIIGSGRNPVPLVFVTDMVQGLLLALDREQAVGQTYNIANDHPLTQGELLSAIAKEIGARSPHIRVPFRPLYMLGSVAERLSNLSRYRWQPLVTRHGISLYGLSNRISIAKARRDLGYAPNVPIREGVRITSAWYRQQDRYPRGRLVLDQPDGKAG